MRILRSSSGFSLIELVVTIAIMAIVMTISTLSFNSWQVKSKIEAQTRELFTDLSEARTNAFTQKKVYGIVFQPTSYVMKTYSSEVEYKTNAAAAANGKVVASKSLKYGLTTKTGADISDSSVVFDTSGFTYNLLTIFVNPVTTPAALNCVVIYSSRVNMGKINGTNCEFR
jgi:type II secretion system protein H